MKLPNGVRSRTVGGVNGLTLHILEAGFEPSGPACKGRIILLHGFPELAYSWRKVLLPLAAAGYHVIAPDQRGYGCTEGWDGAYDGNVASFGMLNLVQDVVALVQALGWRDVTAVVGHDFGSSVAAWCALTRPDVFKSVVMMSAPFGGPPSTAASVGASTPDLHANLAADLAALARPRKHYQWYYSTREADANMCDAPQGLHSFLRAYYHHKSADWAQNQPFKLQNSSALEFAKMPTYYVMDWPEGMAETVAHEMPSVTQISNCEWLPDDELAVYSAAFNYTRFQGALNWYRCANSPALSQGLRQFSGRTIDQPSCFIAGQSDWGIYQKPGAFEAMQSTACTQMTGCHLVSGAGHWVQQEQAESVSKLLLDFLKTN